MIEKSINLGRKTQNKDEPSHPPKTKEEQKTNVPLQY